MQQLCEQQPRGTRTDDRDLSMHAHHASAARPDYHG
jgi:hypothetical protein